MDGERFDRLTRQLATPTNRRSVLRTALAAGAGLFAGRAGKGQARLRGDCGQFYGQPCQGTPECQGIVGADPVCFELACCGGTCTEVMFDDANCGQCGLACPGGSTCNGGQCVSTCQQPLIECDGVCVDPNSDPVHCGGCFDTCQEGAICNGGRCACGGGLSDCGGACVDLDADDANCGVCGGTCTGGSTCTDGQCTCGDGQDSCNGTCVDVSTDNSNCGGCGAVCEPGTSCVDGICTCGNGLTSCGGVCVDLMSDAANCGACGEMCANNGVCVDGTCDTPCPDGMDLCGDACVDLQTDSAHCGGCGNTCPDGTSCVDGECPVSESATTIQVVRDVPGPGLCITEPPGLDRLVQLASTSPATPAAVSALAPVLTPAAADELMATGTDPDPQRQQAALATVRGSLGCENAGDPMRELGGMTDDGIRIALAERGWNAGIIPVLREAEETTFVPLPEDLQVGIAGTISIRELDDGKVAVRFPLAPPPTPQPNPAPPKPGERIYVLSGLPGSMLIDRIIVVDPDAAEPRISGSLAVQMAICPPGMTHESFVASACEPVQVNIPAPAIFASPGDPDSAMLPEDSSAAYYDKFQGSVPPLTIFDSPWDGFYLNVTSLPVGHTYWIELRHEEGVFSGQGVVPGGLGLSLLSGRTYWGVSLTASRPEAVVRAYHFRPGRCGSTCPGDQDLCPDASGTETWIDLSLDASNCGECGNTCPPGTTCANGVCT